MTKPQDTTKPMTMTSTTYNGLPAFMRKLIDGKPHICVGPAKDNKWQPVTLQAPVR